MSSRSRAWGTRRIYEFIKAHDHEYDIKTMCRVLDVSRAGYYAWLHKPFSDRAKEDARLLRLIRASYNASQGVYGSTRIFLDLRDAGETCSKHRVARIMRVTKIRALHGYRTRRYVIAKPSAVMPDLVKRRRDRYPIVSGPVRSGPVRAALELAVTVSNAGETAGWWTPDFELIPAKESWN